VPKVDPLTAIEDLKNLLSLEIPSSFIKEETIRESDDQRKAAYVLTWYSHANNEAGANTINAAELIEEKAADMIGRQYGLPYETKHRPQSDGLFKSAVRVGLKEGKEREAQSRRADADASVPLTLYVGSDVFNVAIDGDDFAILQNGKRIEAGLPSVPFALGRLAVHALAYLPEVEAEAALAASSPNDFLGGIAEAIVEAPDVSDEALAHFATFYEMVTLRDFGALVGDGEP
jgi:hypothetical protein